ncbi:hypothetical protein [Ruania albidiflava]|uniref:hypothetical protein n=1 Tax=Ruania albidiflava TaxID=366586 RepID=UPI0003B531DA|nr:hypothetical protein [Ruania albidiflava]
MSTNPPYGERPAGQPETPPPPAGPPSTGGVPGGPPPGPPPGGPPQGQPGGFGPTSGGYSGPPQGPAASYHPPGGYDGPPPQTGPGGYAPLPPTPQATDGFVWGWNAFKANAGTLILGQLAWLVIVLVIVGLWFGLLSGSGILASTSGSQVAAGAFLGVGILGVILLVVVVVLVGIFASAGMSNATLKLVRGESISVGDFFRFPNVGTIVLVAIVLSVVSALLSFTFILPVALMFFAAYTVLFALDRGEHLVDAITSSVKMALANPGQTILLLLLAYLANLVGGLLCGIGTLVSLPLTALASAWLYRSQLALTPPRQ